MQAARCLQVGALSGALAILLGAFGAHALKDWLKPADLVIYETGVRYQMYHALALCLCGLLAGSLPSRAQRLAAHAFLWGTVLFSGSLYVLVATDTRWLGAITPVGGALLFLGWIAMAVAARGLGRA